MNQKRIEIFDGVPKDCEGVGSSTILLREEIAQLKTEKEALLDTFRTIKKIIRDEDTETAEAIRYERNYHLPEGRLKKPPPSETPISDVPITP